jgi:diphosphomevalonate decarboxylase
MQNSKYIVSEGQVSWRAPSNIAIVKYWGKHGIQLPRNPNISLTLENAFTETGLKFRPKTQQERSVRIALSFRFEGVENEAFKAKQVKFLETLVPVFPFLEDFYLEIDSRNSFPHSAGIASSASSMAALAMCLCSVEAQIQGVVDLRAAAFTAEFLKKASTIARLGSGSACRSVYPIMGQWGKMDALPAASDEYALPYAANVHPVFRTYHDDILIAGSGEKPISSRMGHGLMENNAYAEPRYAQAHARMNALLDAISAGDEHLFGQIAEDEAFTLHALMMTSSPAFTLLKPNTLRMIEVLQAWRHDTKLPVYFSLDAGPNLHLLYPDSVAGVAQGFIQEFLKPLCENERVIEDKVGQGPILMASSSLR